MTDFLEQVVAERRAYAAAAREARGERTRRENLWSYARGSGVSNGRWVTHGPDADAFTSTLRHPIGGGMPVIAEVKRVSPALGTLNTEVDPGEQARRYVAGGASAISVLTEPNHWGGSLRDLERVRDAVGYGVPVLCKDVIVSEIQIEEARSAGADAVLLIAEALSDAELRRFVELARQLNMGALVEAHEPVAFGRAVAAGSRVVGINARNLRRPREIDIGRVRQLHTFARQDQVLVAESGIATADDVRLLPSRVDAVLVGTALMRASDPVLLIRAMSAARASRTREIDVREGVP